MNRLKKFFNITRVIPVLIFLFFTLFYLGISYANIDEYVDIKPKEFSFGKINREDKIHFTFDLAKLKDYPYNLYIKTEDNYLKVEGRNYLIVDWTEGKRQTFNCVIDPLALASGNHNTNILLDYGYEKFKIPVSFYINESPPKLSVSIEKIDFGMVKDTSSDVRRILVKNTGEEVLKVELELDNDWIEISDYSIFLGKNQEKTISISAVKNPPDIRGSFTGFLKIKSNGGSKNIQLNAIFVKEVTLKLNIGSKIAYIDYKKITLDTPPEIFKSRTIVPLRFIGEAFGAKVDWHASTSKITIYFPLKDITITLQIGNNVAYIDDKKVSLEVPPIVKNGRTLVPIRFIGESFGANVDWDSKTQGITITLAY